jgi:hypothetical protein
MIDPDDDRGLPTAADNFLYLLAEMEGCLDRMAPAWSRDQSEKICARLLRIVERAFQPGMRQGTRI